MNLLKLAIKSSPVEAKKILKKINLQDKEISKLISKIILKIMNLYIHLEISAREGRF